ncbi:MAG: amidohydrolase family protein [Thermoleophilaceae bacterium]
MSSPRSEGAAAERLHIRGVILPSGQERDLFVCDGRFSFEPCGDARTVLDHGYLLPGLVDAHTHLAFHSPAPADATWEVAALASAQVELDAGVLTLRDPGGPTPAGLIGPHSGLPRTITAGRFLAAPGRMFPAHGQREATDEELPAAAEEQLRAGDGWVKVIGDFPVRGIGFEPSFRSETLAAVAERVHRLGGRVAIHAVSVEAIGAAVEAGVDSIEHGLMIRPDQAATLAAQGGALTPTMISTPGWLPGALRQFDVPKEEIRRIAAAVERHPVTVREAWQTGLTVLAGTDAAIVAHGLVRDEVHLLASAGIPIEAALAAGSWKAREFLGLPGIEEGAPADLVAFARHPLEDPGTLAVPILKVLDGRLVPAPATTN